MKSPKVAIFGCGFVGECLADVLTDEGTSVVAYTYSGESAQKLNQQKSYSVMPCDLSDPDSVGSNVSIDPEWVVHCASSGRRGADGYREVYLKGCRHLISTFPNSKILYTSSTSVYSQTDGSMVDENSAADPDRETGQILRETEELVLGANGVVVRLAGLYGPHRCYTLKKLFDSTATIEVNEDAPEGRYINQIHRTDAAGAIKFLLSKNTTGIFNAVDSDPLTQRACYDELCKRFDLPMPPVTPPDINRKRGWTHKQVSNQKLLGLGWKPSYPRFMDAIDNDPALVPSIKQLES